ncbi:MAG: hypothetical protein C0475_02020 [Planctomyces sp.]|nr:hypothetical protein [Planctomyces sp.]MBA4039373.1 hypothetical protein [Planctomyces sp.]MBA4119861.1 hypothetical protein [Isosphaera sp.]
MQRILKYIVAGVIVVFILAFMTTYSVYYYDSAVVTTFGRAGAGSVRTEPGLYVRWPYPIQSVVRYDTRNRLVESRPETVATLDNKNLVLTTYMSWRVKDPLRFYQAFGANGPRSSDHVFRAEEILRGQLRAASSVVGGYRLGDLLSTDQRGTKLIEIEQKMLASLSAGGEGAAGSGVIDGSGIEVTSLGIALVRVPANVSQAIFESMKATRERLSSEALSRGESQGRTLETQATADAESIMAFAEQRASSIRAQGDREAVPYLQQQASNPELAVFLETVRFMSENLFSKQTTLVLPFSTPGFGLLRPGVAEALGRGEIPPLIDDAAFTAPLRPADRTGGGAAQGRGGDR